ncbi:MAG TPA: TIGR04282 family arsenosugar biosynthesis glycosyltransferase [Methyloceanibacter sp.]|nr:TIGR04282 family arsenosugar biosynthesis glycosyltransferase [Methyloceanibacter sp.]
MAKRPVMGRVKRRLARETGEVAALRFYRNCLSQTLLRLAQDGRWRISLAVDPDHAVAEPTWPAHRRVALLPQGKGDLGHRMQRLFERLPPGPVIVVGSDIPAIRPAHIAQAFKLLGGVDAVLGETTDGGFWLIGLRRTPKVLRPFAGVRWSSPHALTDTLASLDASRVAFAAVLSDVDTKSDLDQVRDGAQRLIVSDNMPRLPRV